MEGKYIFVTNSVSIHMHIKVFLYFLLPHQSGIRASQNVSLDSSW